ncbi:potassium uptake protein [Xylona heveae TC161]|uniref:Potassium uptake protein n=1 Tax=Xylona heveae (strain CBS 132557 / TC161) TaxID=1328760 RepID=A0A161TPC7_XYLHT|nr:potassium uptake protein [Xylona heveae TC161]KZF24026.1 potassium uptake protein [Xylona heveae TC161]
MPRAHVSGQSPAHASCEDDHFTHRKGVDTTVEATDVQERDIKHEQVFKGWRLLWLAYQSVGVVYGDIGTSPLYVYSSTFASPPSHDDLLGALSLILWSLTLIVTVKYLLIVLRADDTGEGGTFACYSLLSRYSRILRRDPKTATTVKMERYLSSDMQRPNLLARHFVEKSRVMHGILKALAVLGVSLVMADGVLTPAQTVLGAIQGIEVVKSDLSTGAIIGASCAILVALFAIQPFGIAKLSYFFAPIVSIWLAFNFCFGIYNLVKFDYSVLKAFSPYFVGHYFVKNKTEGWKSLSGILLAFTGVEALFADLGAFNRRSIQLSWLCFVYPSLLLAYLGQAAYISRFPTAVSNPFFKSVPPGMFYPSLIISILAAIVASQALITSTFQLLSQLMNLSYFPQIKLIHTSKKFHGQVYIPMANFLLMAGTLIVTGVYHNTTRLGHAYGACVVCVTFITTCLVSLVALIVWRIHPLIVLAGFLFFGTLDGLFLSSALTKVPDGAWFTIMLGIFLSLIFILWRYGKEQQWASEGEELLQTRDIIMLDEKGETKLTETFGGAPLTKIKGLGIFFDKRGSGVPVAYEHFLRKFEASPEVQVFLHMRALTIPHVPLDERYSITRTSIKNCFRIIIRHGYADHVIDSKLGILVYNQIRSHIIQEAAIKIQLDLPPAQDEAWLSSSAELNQARADELIATELRALDHAFETQVVYIVGKEHLRVLDGTNLFKRAVLKFFLWLRENTRTKVESMKVPIDKLVEVGFIKELGRKHI